MGSKTRAGFGAEEKGFRWGIFILLMVLYALFLNPRCWPKEQESGVRIQDSGPAIQQSPIANPARRDASLQPSPFTLLTYRPNPYAESKLKLLALADPASGPAPAGQAAGPEHADQVLLSVYDALNGALKANATLSGGSTNPTPHNADQVFLAIYDPTTGTIRINIVAGSITDPQLASAYSGVGACSTNTWASTLNKNAAPTCTQPAISNLTATISSPLLLNSNTLSIQQANGSQSGYLLSGDWTTFNSKQAALTFNSPLQDSSNTISCPTCEATTNKNASNGYAGLSGGLLSASQLPAPTASTLGGIESLAQTAHQWINSISTSGVPSASQPVFGDISGTVGASQLPAPTASTLGGIESLAQTTHQWINSISTSGIPAASQPAFGDISGTIAASQLPTPTASTLGGIESLAATTHQWINSISTSGVPAASQPAFSDIAGTIAASQLPNVPVTIASSTPVADPGGVYAFLTNNNSGAVTFDAPAGVAGMQRCYRNATGKSGAITIQMYTGNTVDMNGANGSVGSLLSGGALGDAVCIWSDATNHWYAVPSSGTWTNN